MGVEINGFDHNPSEEVSASSYFVGSKNSNVYHRPSCRHAKRIKPENRVYFDTPEEAIAAGYRPCKDCNPPTRSPPSPSLPIPFPSPITSPSPIEPITNFTSVKICAFDQNPAGRDVGNEWVALYNPTNETIDISNWKLKTRYGGGKTVTIPEGTEIVPKDYWIAYVHNLVGSNGWNIFAMIPGCE